MNLTPEQRQSLAEALFEGRKIQAIKQLRDWTGLGLKEAKESVELLEEELRAAQPERFATPARKSGCLLLLILLFPVAVLIWFYIWREVR